MSNDKDRKCQALLFSHLRIVPLVHKTLLSGDGKDLVATIKDAAAGRPAPNIVFWPEDDSEPKVIDTASL